MGWTVRRNDGGKRILTDAELAFLNGRLPTNPDHLTKPTRCRVLKPFMVSGRRVEVGAIVTLRWVDARDMITLGKAEILQGEADARPD